MNLTLQPENRCVPSTLTLQALTLSEDRVFFVSSGEPTDFCLHSRFPIWSVSGDMRYPVDVFSDGRGFLSSVVMFLKPQGMMKTAVLPLKRVKRH